MGKQPAAIASLGLKTKTSSVADVPQKVAANESNLIQKTSSDKKLTAGEGARNLDSGEPS